MSDDLRELLGAYALDAVDPDERAEVERLLEIDPRARAEVAEHREVATLLAYSGAPAPPGLWDRIAASLEEPAPPPRLTLAPVSDLAEHRRRRTRWLGGGIAAAAVAAVIGILGVTVANQGAKIDDLQAALTAPSLARTATLALADPAAERVVLTSADGRRRVQVAIEPDGIGYLVAYELPPLPDDRTYQLWGVVEGRVISLGVLGNAPSVVAFAVQGQPTALVITEEVRGGVPVSEQPPALIGELT